VRCTSCGYENPSGHNYCGSCGKTLVQSSSQSAAKRQDRREARRSRRPRVRYWFGNLIWLVLAVCAGYMVYMRVREPYRFDQIIGEARSRGQNIVEIVSDLPPSEWVPALLDRDTIWPE